MKNTISNININKETLKIRDNGLNTIFKNINYINKRFEYIFYRLKNFKYSFFDFLFDFYNLLIKNYNQKFSADNSFWNNPSHFSKSRIFLKSDSFYRFDYKFYKSTRFDFF